MIELKDVCMAYGDKQVLSAFSYRFDAPGQYALFGPSGCGKTTLLRVIAGLQAPTGGAVRIANDAPISFCFQEDRLLPWYTIAQNVALAIQSPFSSPGVPKRRWNSVPFSPARLEEALHWLALVGLSAEGSAYPLELSGGMKRRASLARALAFDAPILLMDEPFRALDEAAHAQMLSLIREASKDKLLILVTHDARDTQGMQVISMQGPPVHGECTASSP